MISGKGQNQVRSVNLSGGSFDFLIRARERERSRAGSPAVVLLCSFHFHCDLLNTAGLICATGGDIKNGSRGRFWVRAVNETQGG